MTHPAYPDARGAFAHKLEPLNKVTFAAFLLSDPDAKLNPGKAWHVGDFDTLDAACERAAVRHKNRFMVRERNEFTGSTVLHFYVVKQSSKPSFVRRPGMAHTVQQKPLYIEHLFDLQHEDIL